MNIKQKAYFRVCYAETGDPALGLYFKDRDEAYTEAVKHCSWESGCYSVVSCIVYDEFDDEGHFVSRQTSAHTVETIKSWVDNGNVRIEKLDGIWK